MKLSQGYKVMESKQLGLYRVQWNNPGAPTPAPAWAVRRGHCTFLPFSQQLPSFPAEWARLILP